MNTGERKGAEDSEERGKGMRRKKSRREVILPCSRNYNILSSHRDTERSNTTEAVGEGQWHAPTATIIRMVVL